MRDARWILLDMILGFQCCTFGSHAQSRLAIASIDCHVHAVVIELRQCKQFVSKFFGHHVSGKLERTYVHIALIVYKAHLNNNTPSSRERIVESNIHRHLGAVTTIVGIRR